MQRRLRTKIAPGGGRGLLLVMVVMVGLIGCKRQAPPETRLRVSAASSLSEVFDELAAAYEHANPGVDVVLNLAGSQALRLQIEEGAEVDVFASANLHHLEALVDQSLMAPARVFATNELTIIVERDNPLGIKGLEDLGGVERLVIGAPEVPVGRYTERLLANVAQRDPELARELEARVVSRESNVRQVRAKVELGEADAAIVYRTDARSSAALHEVPIPEALQVRAEYGVSRARDLSETQREHAERFLKLVQDEVGQELLRARGFGPGVAR
ncbi:molybdate ABC transporter substrate-binding protein [Lujinxingia litoralis]|nr:molybdate ABC transporter substrate-binding protein [Lujinxingia litoralis]